MQECYKCHTPQTKAILFDVILPHGIDKVCGKCSVSENSPIFRDVKDIDIIEKTPTNKERLERISGVKLDKNFGNMQPSETDKRLKEIVRSNFTRTFSQIPEMEKELVDNFHWIVMRARRMKHYSQEQLAKVINEPIELVKMVEAGNAPQKREVIRKLEDVLGIKIRKEEPKEEVAFDKKELDFDFKDIDDFTIFDLKKLSEGSEK